MLAGLALSRHVWSWNVTAISLKCWSESDQKAIRQQLVRILNSGPFHQSQRRQRFLEYLVNETLAGRGERLKGYNIALEVFDRPETFDPTIDPLVRIEAARLREKLREYYGTDGQGDPIHIDLPKGTYTPQIEFRQPTTPDPRPDRPNATTAELVAGTCCLSAPFSQDACRIPTSPQLQFCLHCSQVSPLGGGGLHPRRYLKKLPSRSCRSRTLERILSGITLPTGLPRTSLQTCLTRKTCLSSLGIQLRFTEASPRT